jgi:hypothetical protein
LFTEISANKNRQAIITLIILDPVTLIQNPDLSQGISNRLDAKLPAIQTAIASAKNNDRPTACNQMNAFDQGWPRLSKDSPPRKPSSNIKAALGFVKIRLR